MNTEKKLRGRPHKKEEDKLIGRRISMIKSEWDSIDEFLLSDHMKMNELFHGVASALAAINIRGEEPCESGQ